MGGEGRGEGKKRQQRSLTTEEVSLQTLKSLIHSSTSNPQSNSTQSSSSSFRSPHLTPYFAAK